MAKAKSTKNQSKEFFEALRFMEAEKGIPAEYIAEKISAAIVVALRKDYGTTENITCIIDCEKEIFKVILRKDIVDEVEDPRVQILRDEAKTQYKAKANAEFVEIEMDTRQFGRIVATTAKHVIRQGIRDVERSQTLSEFQSHNRELLTAVIQRIDPKTGNAAVTIGKSEATLPKLEQVPGEELKEGDHVKVYVVDVKETEKGPKVMLSRTHPGLVKRLFETEVPEIFDGTVEIKSVSRQAGQRTKMAVWSPDPEIDAVGSCIGPKGARVNKIVEELAGEKIDIVKYSENPE
jgi:N utilization substance protein A